MTPRAVGKWLLAGPAGPPALLLEAELLRRPQTWRYVLGGF
ncbi:MAG TPA: hypothetical protein PKG50_01490 [Candidatus Bipolaricaulis anaerobius]|nr:hypothetical protein [Candidatus Bipolaricaulis anaerobius]HNR24091.1 hypothetical protein [Candidatus Bipolaricaulis anaerobius]HNS23826.1 hypothetical protein [Candidatus Bipolaricaulis anaerobius]